MQSDKVKMMRSVVLVVLLGLAAKVAPADTVELTSGSKIEGQIVARDAKYLTVNTLIGGRTYSRKYPLERIAAITVDGKREVISSPASATSIGGGNGGNGGTATAAVRQRSAAEVEALINQMGRSKPDWWDSVSLNYPETLDLSWPQPPPPPWNNQKNIGQYVWDIINHNPNKWREGVRFMLHVLTINERNPEVRWRAMSSLGRMYHTLLEDYSRAAFWWRQAQVDRLDYASLDGVHLAECYWKLGSKPMALDLLRRMPPHFATIKVLADMGETGLALRLADANTSGPAADVACIYAGDACRVAGRHQDALRYYNRVLSLRAEGNAKGRIERNQQRARANIEAIKLFDTLDLARVPDGTYQDSSMGYEAPVRVEVTVKGGRIESVRVTEHREKQFYAAMTDTPRKIIEKQSVKGIDATSSATITSDAIVNATAKALSGAMK